MPALYRQCPRFPRLVALYFYVSPSPALTSLLRVAAQFFFGSSYLRLPCSSFPWVLTLAFVVYPVLDLCNLIILLFFPLLFVLRFQHIVSHIYYIVCLLCYDLAWVE